MTKHTLTFTVEAKTLAQLDRLRERCGCPTYADVLGRALATFDTLSELAADSIGLIHVEVQPKGQQFIQATVSIPEVTQAFERAREQERILDLGPPPIPPPAPAAAPPEPTRRWWWPWP